MNKTNKKKSHRKFQLFSYGLLFQLVTSTATGMPANPNIIIEKQPNGNQVELRIYGDEHGHRIETIDGFTVKNKNGWYTYAMLNASGKLEATNYRVGSINPIHLGIQKSIKPSALHRKNTIKVMPKKKKSFLSPLLKQESLPSGTVKNLVIPIRFNDHLARTLPSTQNIDILFNAVGGNPSLAPTGSIRDLYYENSYGKMELKSDIQNWIDVTKNETYYANGQSGDSTLWEALKEALDAVDKTIDFRDYDTDNDGYIDAIAFLHSGYAAEWGGKDSSGAATADRIWSHRWSIQSAWVSEEGIKVADYHISPALWGTSGDDIGRIGVIAHETGHFFGLPDLYDTDNSGGSGIGSYGLMANSWGFDGTQLCPPHFSPWSKEQLDWINPIVIDKPSKYGINDAESNAEFYKITKGYPEGEYLMIENRQNKGFDCSLPQGGLAIWHIDESTGFNTEGFPGLDDWPLNGKHYQVSLLQADGDYGLEKGWNSGDRNDLFHADNTNKLSNHIEVYPNTNAYQNGKIIQSDINITNVSAAKESMTFCINDCGTRYSETHNNLAARNLDWIHYTIDVPAGTKQLNAIMKGGSGDADLWVVYNQRPDTTNDYDCIPFLYGNNENCSISNPKPGTWYVSIQGFDDFEGVTLTLEYN
jgi:M6 family metalloprotease-like protein